jgi:hypothetical protein
MRAGAARAVATEIQAGRPGIVVGTIDSMAIRWRSMMLLVLLPACGSESSTVSDAAGDAADVSTAPAVLPDAAPEKPEIAGSAADGAIVPKDAADEVAADGAIDGTIVPKDVAVEVAAGPLCQGQPLPSSRGPYGVCPDETATRGCRTIEDIRANPECWSLCAQSSVCSVCGPSGWVLGSFECPRGTPDGGATPPGTLDSAIAVDTAGPSIIDAGQCRGEPSELASLGWEGPCPSLVDAGVPSLSCIDRTPGLKVYWAACDQGETLHFSFGGTHSQVCFYEHGSLVGLKMQNDTPAFCNQTSSTLTIGSTDGCPSATASRILDCTPFVDSDWQPRGADAR